MSRDKMPAKKRSHRDNGRLELRRAAVVLKDAETFSLTLENGDHVGFSVASELAIPHEPEALGKAAREAPAQLAFWAAQTERMLVRLRKAEAVLDEAEARQYLVYRKWYESEGDTPTEAMIRARLSQDVQIRRFRIALRARKKEYGAVRAIKDAVNHRVSMVRVLIGRYEP